MVVVEEDREQPDVVARRFHFLVVVGADFARRLLDRVGGAAVELDQLEGLDLLRLAVLGDLEVALLQVRDRIAFLVGDDDVDADEVDPGAENRRWLGGIRRRLRRRRRLLRGRLLRLLGVAGGAEDEQQRGPGGNGRCASD